MEERSLQDLIVLEINANRHDSSSNKPIYTNQVSFDEIMCPLNTYLYDQKVVVRTSDLGGRVGVGLRGAGRTLLGFSFVTLILLTVL